jgi:SAM-dependent methyltransferase
LPANLYQRRFSLSKKPGGMKDRVNKNHMDITALNKKAFESTAVLSHYTAQKDLFKPEQTILGLFRDRFRDLKMLDIGVGAGRTTIHFAPLVAEYLGIDYAENMINYCRQAFPNWAFEVMDVKSMPALKTDYFDFILISYNGLDYSNHEERLTALGEIRRVCKKDGYLCFSSHNLQSIDRLFALRFSFNPFIFWRRLLRYNKLRRLNPPPARGRQQGYAIINDGVHDYKIWHYYITPAEQIRQLHECGFGNVRLFSNTTGQEVSAAKGYDSLLDFMIYYLCNKV